MGYIAIDFPFEGIILRNFQFYLNVLIQIGLQFFIMKIRDAFLFVKGKIVDAGESLNFEDWVVLPYSFDGEIVGAHGEV